MITHSARLLNHSTVMSRNSRKDYAFQVLAALISTRENTPIPEEKLDGYIKQAILITDKMLEELDK